MLRRAVYLAGPITGVTHADAIAWREHAYERFHAAGIDAYSPMRFGAHGVSGDKVYSDAYSDPDSIFSTVRGILDRDIADLSRCDLTLFNFIGAKRISIGSCVEAGAVYVQRKLIVIAIEGAKEILKSHGQANPERDRFNPHDHAFLTGLTPYIRESLDDAIDASIRLLRPTSHFGEKTLLGETAGNQPCVTGCQEVSGGRHV